MQYSILVFNRETLGEITEKTLLNSITESNYETLCRQYGLDPSLIKPALGSLEVVTAKNENSPFFVLRYGEGHGRAFVVQQWDASSRAGKKFLHQTVAGVSLEILRLQLLETRWLVEVALAPLQLKDMGLLVAYEVARWAAERGMGVVYGLDGVWYRLNRHKAFIPIKYPKKYN